MYLYVYQTTIFLTYFNSFLKSLTDIMDLNKFVNLFQIRIPWEWSEFAQRAVDLMNGMNSIVPFFR